MKKYVTIAIILAVVVAIHIFLLRPLISSDEDKKPEQVKPVPEIIKPEEPAPVVNTLKHASKNPLFGKFFDYRKAIWGDKLPVAGCKEVHAGILADLDNHKVLWAKNPRTGVPIASMTKMMTLLLAVEAIDKNPDIDLETLVQVTKEAAGIGGSQVYLDVRETHPLGELLKTMAIKSANDSAYLVAEYIDGYSTSGFVKKMNKRAFELRMPSTVFVNPHGLTIDKKNCMGSPEGMLILAENLLQYPLLMKWFSTITAYFRPEGDKHRQLLTNTNRRLLQKCRGVDGMKTGYTRAAGFCITATCLRNGRRLVAVVTGFKTSKSRNAFVAKLFDWGFGQIDSKK